MLTQQVVDDFALEVTLPPQTEEELLDLLADAVGYLIEKRIEYLMQTLYTMDVDEDAMRYAFSDEHEQPVNVVLAHIILDREKRKAQTRIEYRPDNPRDWSEDF